MTTAAEAAGRAAPELTRRQWLKTHTVMDWCIRCGDGAAHMPPRFRHPEGFRPAHGMRKRPADEGIVQTRHGALCAFCVWWHGELDATEAAL